MASHLLIPLVAFLVAGLTLFSGFGLGTLLMPAFALFFPIPVAVAATAVVHLANNLFKLTLVGRHADRRLVLRFGLPAVVAAFLGAWLLARLSGAAPLTRYTIGAFHAQIEPVGLVIGLLIVAFAVIELHPASSRWQVHRRFLPLGGLLSGFFGGLSGNQGAFRSAFLIKAGLSPAGFIATGVVIAVLVDLGRLLVYGLSFLLVPWGQMREVAPLVGLATAAAFIGSFLGARLIGRVTLPLLQRIVATLLIVVGVGLALGLL